MLSLLLMCSSITPAILTWERHRIPAYSTSNAIMSYGFNNTPALPWIHGDSWLCVCICAQTCHKLVNHNICWDIICIFLFFFVWINLYLLPQTSNMKCHKSPSMRWQRKRLHANTHALHIWANYIVFLWVFFGRTYYIIQKYIKNLT